MLEQRIDTSLITDEWEIATAQVQIPEALQNHFFEKSDATPVHADDIRRYQRFTMRVKAIIRRGEVKLGCYTKDLSRQGVGLLSPMSLLPRERVELQLPYGYYIPLQIVRCRRLGIECYECGAKFAPPKCPSN